MAVLPLKSEPKCKICSSPHRVELDDLLEIRSKRGDLDGQRVNEAFVVEKMIGFGIPNPNSDNIRVHWRKHCRVIEDEVVEQAQAALVVRLQEMQENGVEVDINKDLDLMWAIGMTELQERIARGDRSGISPEMLLKIAAEKTRRSHNETQDKLMGVLAGGIAHAISGGKNVIELPKHVQDAEIITVEDFTEERNEPDPVQ